MKEYLSAARRKRFCECYLRTLDPGRAAEEAGESTAGWLAAESEQAVSASAASTARKRRARKRPIKKPPFSSKIP